MSGVNTLTFRELCRLFCCPPCPSQIASKLAFLPPDPTYTVTVSESEPQYSLILTERAEWQYSDRELKNIEVCDALSVIVQ